MTQLFDQWPDKYSAWFKTPIGALVRHYEQALMLDMLQPAARDRIADIGCGSGIFTADIVQPQAEVVGLDISLPMLQTARQCLNGFSFSPVAGDMLALPLADRSFDKVVSITALEFIADGQQAVDELLRILKPGGSLVLATLNAKSPWAKRRTEQAGEDSSSLFNQAYFRTPEQLQTLVGLPGTLKTAIHFAKQDDVDTAIAAETEGQRNHSDCGAFVIGHWRKA